MVTPPPSRDTEGTASSLKYAPGRLVARVASSLARFDAALARHERLSQAIELLAAVAIIVTAGANLWTMLQAMATTSLWNDEIYSVLKFSGPGPWTAITDYHVANNHMFFNLVNALTPGAGSVAPLRARLWSFIAVLLALGLLLWHFGRRRRFLGGALAFTVIAGQGDMLDLTLQARGYGFLCLAAVAVTLAIAHFFETRSAATLCWLAGTSILGAWTIPTFVLFSGSVLLLLWAALRARAVFYCGAAVALCVAALYGIVFEQLMHEMTTYAEQWGESYAGLSAVFDTLTYLWPTLTPWVAMVVIVVTLVAPYHLPPAPPALAARLLSAAVFACFALFLFQKTPQIRTTFFVVIPLAYVLITVFSELLRSRGATVWLASSIATALLVVSGVRAHGKQYSFTPMEAWLEVATYIHDHFPPGTTVHAPFRSQHLKLYLDPAYPLAGDFDAASFSAGRQVHVDGTFGRKLFDPHEYSDRGVTVQIPQRRGGYQAIAFVPPP